MVRLKNMTSFQMEYVYLKREMKDMFLLFFYFSLLRT